MDNIYASVPHTCKWAYRDAQCMHTHTPGQRTQREKWIIKLHSKMNIFINLEHSLMASLVANQCHCKCYYPLNFALKFHKQWNIFGKKLRDIVHYAYVLK